MFTYNSLTDWLVDYRGCAIRDVNKEKVFTQGKTNVSILKRINSLKNVKYENASDISYRQVNIT